MSSLSKAVRRTGIRLDPDSSTPTLALQAERSNWVASRVGLPAVGSTVPNKHGIQWIVQCHAPLPTYESLLRFRTGDIQPHDDLYPVLMPTNFSPQLMEFFHAIDRCTTKAFSIVDTMPGLRKNGHVPGGNQIDTVCNPATNVLFLDALRVNETVIAHELAHAWVQYVDECEDLRTMRDANDPQRMRMVGFIQSFVLDLKVNALIRRKGFDMSPIDEDRTVSIRQLAQLLKHGYSAKHLREEVFMALLVADLIADHDGAPRTDLVRADHSLDIIRSSNSPLSQLSEKLADSVTRHGLDSRAGITAAIDECLVAAFEHCGDRFDLDRELIEVNPEEPDLDKFPAWLPPLSPKTKAVVGKHMARSDISSDWAQRLEPSITGRARVYFTSPDGERSSKLQLSERIGPPNRYSDLPEFEAELLAIKHLNQTKSYQLHGGPPHQLSDLHRRPEYSTPPPVTQPRIDPMNPQASPNIDLPGIRPPRPYMAGTGRFLTAARWQEQLAGEHPYAYANNNPVTYVDPTGRQPQGGPPNPPNQRCKVYRCVTPTPPISHNFICVISSSGRACSGGNTPDWGGPHGISDSTYSSCLGNEGVECHLITTDCRVADEVCRMLDYLRQNPNKVPRYDASGLTSVNCVSFVDWTFCQACDHLLHEVVRKGLPDSVLLQLANDCSHCTQLVGWFGSDEQEYLRWLRNRFGAK